MEGHIILEKYMPKSISEFVGCQQYIDEFNAFLHNESTSSLLMIGPSGSGKTTLCKLLLSHNLITNVFEPFLTDQCLTHKEFESQIMNFINIQTLTEVFNVALTKKVIFLDNVESILIHDRYANQFTIDLLKKVRKLPNVKVVMIAGCSDEKRLTDIKKVVDVLIRVDNPSKDDVYRFVTTILDKEEYEYDEDLLKKSIVVFKHNVRNIILNLFTEFSLEHEELQRSYFDMNIFTLVQNILNNFQKDLNDLECALSCDPTLVACIMYDNFMSLMPKQNHQLYKYTSYIRKIYFVTSLIEEHAYLVNDWTLVEYANLIRCGVIRATQKELYDFVRRNAFDAHEISYTQIPTRAAQHFNNCKKLTQVLWQKQLTTENMVNLADLCFQKVIKIDDDHNVFLSYQNNICDKIYRVHRPYIFFK